MDKYPLYVPTVAVSRFSETHPLGDDAGRKGRFHIPRYAGRVPSSYPSGRPTPSSPAVRDRFRTQRRQGTFPEVSLRKELHRRGLRYRIGIKVPGFPRRTIDIAFPRQKVAIFVDGCFWHRCPEHYVPVKNNSSWWEGKLASNVRRDEETTQSLRENGWLVERVWEHCDPVETASKIERIVRNPSGDVVGA